MTQAKTFGRILLWAMRLGLFVLGPSLVLLAFTSIISRPNPPLIIVCIITFLLMAGLLYYGATAHFRFPLAGAQTNCIRLTLAAVLFAAGSFFSFLLYVGLAWLKFRGAILGGSSPYYLVPETTLTYCLASTVFLGLICFALWLRGMVANAHQLRLLTWMLALTLGMGPFTSTVARYIAANENRAFWEVSRTAIGPDNETYHFLREGQMQYRGERPTKHRVFSAVARHLGGNPLFTKVDIIFSVYKSHDPQGALAMGKHHPNAVVREACAALIEKEKVSSRRGAKSGEKGKGDLYVAQFSSANSASSVVNSAV
jgi:hypothetical protein